MNTKLSELLLKLSEKAKKLEEKVNSSEQLTKENLNDWVSEVKAKSDEGKAEFKEKTNNLKSEAKTHWQKIQEYFSNQVAKGKDDISELKHSVKVADAEMYANWAEDDAEISVQFALNAFSDAEESIAEAIRARLKAESL